MLGAFCCGFRACWYQQRQGGPGAQGKAERTAVRAICGVEALTNGKNKSLRVALIVSEQTLCEYSALLERLLVGLADESIPVALIYPPGREVQGLLRGTVELLQHPAVDLPFVEPFSRKTLAGRLAGFKPHLIHCLCQTKATLAGYLARRLELPYVLNVNSLQKRRHPFHLSAARCAAIITPAKSIAESVRLLHPRFKEIVRQINPGTFAAGKSCCFAQPGRVATMMLTHPLDNVNDFENLFTAARHMMLDGYEFVVLVMAGGRAEGQVRELLAALDLLRIVTIVPRLRPWRSVLSAGDIFIQPRPDYKFNPFMLEAMSVGAAVVGCRGGVADLIIDGKTAMAIDPDDEISITATLKQLLGRRELARKIGQAAQNYVRENYSVSAMMSQVLQTYNDAVQWHTDSSR